jgi:hypothetical protein
MHEARSTKLKAQTMHMRITHSHNSTHTGHVCAEIGSWNWHLQLQLGIKSAWRLPQEASRKLQIPKARKKTGTLFPYLFLADCSLLTAHS